MSVERAGPYELAQAGFCERKGVGVLVLLNAWLIPEDGEMEGIGRQCYQVVGAGASWNGEDDGSDGEVVW